MAVLGVLKCLLPATDNGDKGHLIALLELPFSRSGRAVNDDNADIGRGYSQLNQQIRHCTTCRELDSLFFKAAFPKIGK